MIFDPPSPGLTTETSVHSFCADFLERRLEDREALESARRANRERANAKMLASSRSISAMEITEEEEEEEEEDKFRRANACATDSGAYVYLRYGLL